MENERQKTWQKVERLESKAHLITNRVKTLGVTSLCGRCSHSMIYKRKGYAHTIIRCRILETEVSEDIHECSGYDDPSELSMEQMVNLALIIDPREMPEGGNYL